MGRSASMILGIETSCDETAAAVITPDGRILSNVVSSQADLHARYGGVVPEVASRRHLELITQDVRGDLRDELGVAERRRFKHIPARIRDDRVAVHLAVPIN